MLSTIKLYDTNTKEVIREIPSEDTIKMLEGLVDIYLPDMKFKSSELSKEYSNAPDYFEVASGAIDEMVRQVGEPKFTGDMMSKGVVVRHMILPGSTKDSKEIIKYLLDTYGKKIFISIMNQYTPMEGLDKYPNLTRRVTKREYENIVYSCDYSNILNIHFL